MIKNMFLRRAIVVVAVTTALVGGAASIRAAGLWTAASAPLAVAPASLTSINTALAAEQDRSAALEEQLRSISTAAAELQAALTAAQDQVATDATTAETLRADLAAAKKKLATLEASLRAAARAKVAPTSTGSKIAPARTAEPHDDD